MNIGGVFGAMLGNDAGWFELGKSAVPCLTWIFILIFGFFGPLMPTTALIKTYETWIDVNTTNETKRKFSLLTVSIYTVALVLYVICIAIYFIALEYSIDVADQYIAGDLKKTIYGGLFIAPFYATPLLVFYMLVGMFLGYLIFPVFSIWKFMKELRERVLE